MKISLTDKQSALLRQVIGSELVRLSDAIRHDRDYPEYVREYKAKIKRLEKIYNKLNGYVPQE